MRRHSVWLLVGLLSVAGCGGAEPVPVGAPTDTTTQTVTMGGYHFVLPIVGDGKDSAAEWRTEGLGGAAKCHNERLGVTMEVTRGQLKVNDEVVAKVETGDTTVLTHEGQLLHNGKEVARVPIETATKK
jgi:hypothetical protein